MTYKTSLDKTAIAITIAVTIFFAIIIVRQFSFITDTRRTVSIYTTTACLLIYLLAFAFRPINYVVTKDEVIVRRPLLNVHIKRADINSVELIDKKKLQVQSGLLALVDFLDITEALPTLLLAV